MADFRDTFTAAWRLEVNGAALPAAHLEAITSLEAEITVDGADQLVVQAVTWDSVRRRWLFVQDNVLAPGNTVDLFLGYGSDLRFVQRFQVVAHEADYPQGDAPTVTVRAYSVEHRLVQYQDARSWDGPVSDTEVVTQIAQDHGLDVSDVQQGLPQREAGRVKPKGTTDWQFLQELAEVYGFGPPRVRWSQDKRAHVLTFRATDLSQQPDRFTFVYDVAQAGSSRPSGNLLQFQPELNLSDVPTSVKVTGWDRAKGQVVEVTLSVLEGTEEAVTYRGGTPAEIRDLSDGATLQVAVLAEGKGKADKPEVISSEDVTTEQEALDYARRVIDTWRRAYMTARALVHGDPRIWVGDVHRFTGVGRVHAGLWEVLAVRHKVDAGYTCDLDLQRVLEAPAQPRET